MSRVEVKTPTDNNFKELNQPINVVAIALFHSDLKGYFIFRRNKAQSGAGEWEFPGGKVESIETHEQALVREIKEELLLDIEIKDLIFVGSCEHTYNPKSPQAKTIKLSLYKYPTQLTFFKMVDHDSFACVNEMTIKKYNLSQADLKFLPQIFKNN